MPTAKINETSTFGQDGEEEDIFFEDVDDDADVDDVSTQHCLVT